MKNINQLTLILIAAALLFIMFFSKVYTGYTPFLVMLIITFGLSVLNLFLIHHRNLQLRLCIYNTIILLALQGWIAYVLISIRSMIRSFPLSSIFPLIAAILTIVAISMIRRDKAVSQLVDVLKRQKKNRKIKNLRPNAQN